MKKNKDKDAFEVKVEKEEEIEGKLESKEYTEPKTVKPNKFENCKVLWIKSNNFAVSFKGYGITLDGKIEHLKNVKVEYKGEIGKPDFKIISTK